MVETQNQNLQLIEEQFNAISVNFHILRDCTQRLFSNQQVNFVFDTMSSILSLLYSDVKSYRSAIYTYRMNVLNAIPTLLQQHLPMLLVPYRQFCNQSETNLFSQAAGCHWQYRQIQTLFPIMMLSCCAML